MKLAEALILRADYQERMRELGYRLGRSARVQEGDKPPEDPQMLLAELEKVASELERLIQAINRTNSASELAEGVTITDALATRDVLRAKQEIYRDLASTASVTQGRVSRSEVKYRSTVDVAEIQKRADEVAMAHRELDTRIQEANWRVELVE
ncbi:MAG: DIP1984 family protein [Anaerolineae bacterium]|nr:DIP1984 family protein [Anaerolineae bacterium]